MKKYIPVVLFVFSCQVFSADIHGRVVRVLDGDTIRGNDAMVAAGNNNLQLGGCVFVVLDLKRNLNALNSFSFF